MTFTPARSIAIQVPRQDIPFDGFLRFNKKLNTTQNKSNMAQYALDPAAMLEAVRQEDYDALSRITLVGQDSHGTVGLWDSLHNEIVNSAFVAVMFCVSPTFSPIPERRIGQTSTYLNYTMSSTKIFLNRIQSGDHIGIGLYHAESRQAYVLIYKVMGQCHVVYKRENGDRSMMLPSANCEMMHLMIVGDEDRADVYDFGTMSYDEEAITPFSNRILQSVFDIAQAFPWKAHFTPQRGAQVENIDPLVEQLLGDKDVHEDAGFDRLEELCRKAYQIQATKHHAAIQRSKGFQDRRRPKVGGESGQVSKPVRIVTPLPMMQVVSLPHHYVIKIDMGHDAPVLKIPKEEIDTYRLSEIYLTNNDLGDGDPMVNPQVIPLPETVFDETAFVRYFSIMY